MSEKIRRMKYFYEKFSWMCLTFSPKLVKRLIRLAVLKSLPFPFLLVESKTKKTENYSNFRVSSERFLAFLINEAKISIALWSRFMLSDFLLKFKKSELIVTGCKEKDCLDSKRSFSGH